MDFIKELMDQYGYLILFLALMLELVAVPIPGEILMSYAGFLVYQGKLDWIGSIIMAGMGSSAGITIAYLIGFKLGAPFFHKYGPRIHLGPNRMERISMWFKRYGNKVLIIGYFIPGVRHITGYFSGITKIAYRTFSLYAYTGAFIWASTFISLGKILGPKWAVFHGPIKKYLIFGGILVALIVAGIYLYRNYKKSIFDITKTVLNKAVQTFHSLRRVKALVFGAAVVFLGLFVLMIGLIQDYLGHEFAQFDTIVLFLVNASLKGFWPLWMKQIAQLASFKVLLLVTISACLWIWIKKKDRRLKANILLFVLFGGEVLEEGLRRIFHRVGPASSTLTGKIIHTFPSEQSFMIIAVFGMLAFLLIRHSKHIWSQIVIPFAVLIFSILIGLNNVYFEVQYPSDVVAGYVFGGVWLSLNIIMLEIFRLLGPVTGLVRNK